MGKAVILALGAVFCATPALAQMGCGTQPQSMPTARMQAFQQQAGTEAKALGRNMPHGAIVEELGRWSNETGQRYPDLDRAEVKMYRMWAACQAIMRSEELNDAQKAEQWRHVHEVLSGAPMH